MTQHNMTDQNINSNQPINHCFIKAITLENYKSIKSLQIFQMKPVNILIGANGAGKSAFLKFFELLKYCLMEECIRDDYIAKNGGADWLLTGGIKNKDRLNNSGFPTGMSLENGDIPSGISVNIDIDYSFIENHLTSYTGGFTYSDNLELHYFSPHDENRINHEVEIVEKLLQLPPNSLSYDWLLELSQNFINNISFGLFPMVSPMKLLKIDLAPGRFFPKTIFQNKYQDQNGKDIAADTILYILDTIINPLQQYMKFNHHIINNIQQYHFHDTSDTSPILSTQELCNNEKLLADGRNIAPFLYRLHQEYPESFALIQRTVKSIVPDFYEFVIRSDRKAQDPISLEWRHKNYPEDIWSGSRLSDGSLRIICLITLLYQPLGLMPKLILIDEPEIGLHPEAMQLISNRINSLSASTQFILATQSTTFINYFSVDEIVVVDKLADGTSTFDRLDHIRLHEWLKTYTLGQLWENNVFGGQP